MYSRFRIQYVKTFFFFLSSWKDEKGRIKTFHSRCVWRGQKCFRGFFSPSPLQWISNQNYCKHGRAMFSWILFQLGHCIVDWKEWVWFTCLKVREMVPIQRLWQRREQAASPTVVRQKKCGLLLCSVNVFYIKKPLEWRLEVPFFSWINFLTQSKSSSCCLSQTWIKMEQLLQDGKKAKVILMWSPPKTGVNLYICHIGFKFLNH